MLSAIRLVTVGVSDMDQSLALFRDIMDLRVEADYAAARSLTVAWGLPVGVAARIVELSCNGYPTGRLRLVSYSPTPVQKVRVHNGPGPHDQAVDIGCKAIDFYVPAPMRPVYDALVAAGYETRSEPVLHEVGGNISEEFVFWGPDGVPLLLMVGHKHPASQMRQLGQDGPFSEVATISIVGADLSETRRFYEQTLGLSPVLDDATPDEFEGLVNTLTGTPAGTRIDWLLYADPAEPSGKILVVHFGDPSARRLTGRMRPGHLGFSLLTHETNDLDALADRLRAGGYAIRTEPCQVEVAGQPQRLMLAVGPNEELFEFVERR